MTTEALPTILVIGSGGREHAIAWRLSVGEGNTPKSDRHVVFAPGNAGAANDVTCRPTSLDPASIVALAKETDAALVVIGPEQPLVDGAIDALVAEGIPCVGPVAAAAALEGSKAFMKDLCREAGVDTAAYGVVRTRDAVDAFIAAQREAGATKLVVKADGLCGGKGVTVCSSLEEARQEAYAFLGSATDDDDKTSKFGRASEVVILEEFLEGEEVSVFALCDGQRAHLLATARDHKRLGDDDVGPNTGGMGAIGPLGPSDGVTDAFLQTVRDDVVGKTLDALAARKTPYRGILYAGLMVDNGRVRLLEFNVRLGDPEAQALLFATSVDFLPTFLAIGRGESLPPDDGALAACSPVACVVLASEGYPQAPKVGRPIEIAPGDDVDSKIFFAGVKAEGAGLVTSGGRVLAAVARGPTADVAIANAYRTAERVQFDGAHRRSDIGASVVDAARLP